MMGGRVSEVSTSGACPIAHPPLCTFGCIDAMTLQPLLLLQELVCDASEQQGKIALRVLTTLLGNRGNCFTGGRAVDVLVYLVLDSVVSTHC
jgi:hypothetical protein